MQNPSADDNQPFSKLLSEAERNQNVPTKKVKAALQALPKIQATEVDELVAAVDKDNTGTVTMQQFSELILSSEKLAEIMKRSEAHEDVSTRVFLR